MFFLAILITLAAYLIGSLSAALIVSKKLGMPDPRTYGSGNPGASNMLRSGRKDAAAWTLFGDALKGLIAVLIARGFYTAFDSLGAGVVACAAIAVVIGHMWPIFFEFKGGKGVATALGVLLGMSLIVTCWVFFIWAVIALKFKKSSLAALIAAAVAPFVTFITLRNDHVTSWGWSILFISILVIYRHRDNIKRMLNGNELLIGEAAQPLDNGEVTRQTPTECAMHTTQNSKNENTETTTTPSEQATETIDDNVTPANQINHEVEKNSETSDETNHHLSDENSNEATETNQQSQTKRQTRSQKNNSSSK